MKYTVLGISSGLGVSLYPFKEHVIANIEGRGLFHTKSNEQWESNFGDIPLYQLLPAKNSFGKVDVIISSPDCGSGSVFRFSRAKKLGDHKGNKSLAMFFSSIEIYKPKFFEFENLDGLFKSFPEADFDTLLPNYRLLKHLAPVTHWGNSQKTRKRLIVIGIRKDISKKVDKYFRLPDYRDRIKTCKQLYESKPNMGLIGADISEPINTVISIHAKKRMSLLEIRDTWQGRLKGKKRWETEPGFNFSTAPGVYRNLRDDYPATARKANRQFDSYGNTLSPRSLARIQGVPDDFKLYMDEDRIQYWINKGRTVVTKTPPMEISVWFKKKLDKTLKKNLWK